MAVLVLNYDYQPIHITTWRRAIILVLKQKAEVVEARSDRRLRTVRTEYAFPSIIRLMRYVPVPYKHIPLTRQNIFRRDGFRCAYCGTSHNLTIDHVIPRSQGGESSWENLVTACESCNRQKGNRTPQQAGMPLLIRPRKPHYLLFWLRGAEEVDTSWRPYLMLEARV
ncbi:MAG: HNH endonuclease [Bacteroidia bacterium]|nr:HNH endonuclease [Bacteroidia bacterium]MCX7653036.1 HNH endonuclease [Bacteroidia bacterium]MDW8416174.1 HNH endonuclease [Bacteroidia bacterium]